MDVCFAISNKILRILNAKGLAPDLPEDPYHLLKKVVTFQKHSEQNRVDKNAKFFKILIEVNFTDWFSSILPSESPLLPVSIENMGHQ